MRKEKAKGHRFFNHLTVDHNRDRLEYLKLAAREYGLLLNCRRWPRSSDPDIQWLLKRGYIRINRTFLGNRHKRSAAYATEQGKTFLGTQND